MSPSVVLSSSEDKVADLKVPLAHAFVVITTELLLVPCGMKESHVSSFFKLDDGVCERLLVCLFVVGLESRGPVLEVGGKDGLGSVDHEEWGEPHGLTRHRP